MTAFQKGCIDPALSAVTAALPILGAETAVSKYLDDPTTCL